MNRKLNSSDLEGMEEVLIDLNAEEMNPIALDVATEIAKLRYLDKLRDQDRATPTKLIVQNQAKRSRFQLAQEACDEALDFVRIRFVNYNGRKISFTKAPVPQKDA